MNRSFVNMNCISR